MTTTAQNDRFTITAERQYRRVYQGTLYTVNWADDKGEHQATCRNFHHLARFATNGFSTDGLRGAQWWRIEVIA